MMKNKFSIQSRIQSFKHAFDGLKTLIVEEHNARIHLGIAFLVVCLGLIFDISASEWMFICFAIGLVVSMEAINSAIECLSDFVSPGYSEQIKKVKDLAAFAVLFCAFASVIIGLIIFIPKLINLFA